MSYADQFADYLRTFEDETIQSFIYMYAKGAKCVEDLDWRNEDDLNFLDKGTAYSREDAEVLLNI